jgi:ribokinase
MRFLVSGGIGLEINIPVNQFPIEYKAVEHYNNEISFNVAGGGYNLAKSLKTLGCDVTLGSVLANDRERYIIKEELKDSGIDIVSTSTDQKTLMSVVLYDETGKRLLMRDGKNIHLERFNDEVINEMTKDVDFAILTIANFSRNLIPHLLGEVPIAIDLHEINSIDDEYRKEFIECADILFFSHENVNGSKETFIDELFAISNASLICMSCGGDGVLLKERTGEFIKKKAPDVKVVNTIGAGDALFSSFCYFHALGNTVNIAMDKALIYVGQKIQHNGASIGFVSSSIVNEKYNQSFK